MKDNKVSLRIGSIGLFWQYKIFAIVTGFALVLTAFPAMAHHAMGSKMPSNFFDGFLSGLAHPVIGIDHLAFIVSVGLLSAVKKRGIWIAIAFVLSAMAGTGLHLVSLNLPGVELFVSGSILLFGILMVIKDSPNTPIVTALAALAGIFHGYAYGESIFGAEMTPLLAYLLGFTAIQLTLTATAFWISNKLLQRENQQPPAAKPQDPEPRSKAEVFFDVGMEWMTEARNRHEVLADLIIEVADVMQVRPDWILEEAKNRSTEAVRV